MSLRVAPFFTAICAITILHCGPARAAGETLVDRYGDPLPDGAVARMGTVRFRHGGVILAGVFAADGKTLTTYGADEMIRTWSVPDGRQVREVPRQGYRPDWVASSEFSADGKLLALVCRSRTDGDHLALLCDAASGRELRRVVIAGAGKGVDSIALSPDGKRLATAYDGGKITAWDSTTGERLYTVDWKKSWWKTGLTFSHDGTILASGSGFNFMALWDARTGRQLKEMTGQSKDANFSWVPARLTFSPDGKSLVSAEYQNIIRIWDVKKGEERASLRHSQEKVKDKHRDTTIECVSYSPDGATLAAITEEGWLYLWEVKTGRKLLQAQVRQKYPTGRDGDQMVLFAPDGRTLATWDRQNAIQLWEVQSGKELNGFDEHRGFIETVAFSSDGRSLATTG